MPLTGYDDAFDVSNGEKHASKMLCGEDQLVSSVVIILGIAFTYIIHLMNIWMFSAH